MRRLLRIHVTCWLALAAPAAALGQTASSSAQTPAPAQTQAPAAASPTPETPRSLFDPTPRQFQIGGRFSSVDGDPARWQRYQDLRDGVLFTDARYAHDDAAGNWLFRATADNVGYRDQRYSANYQRTGAFVISGLWDEIPQFYSVDTKTPYTTKVSPLLLDDATQRAIQNGQANLSAYIPIAPQFDLMERRDIGTVNFRATPTPQIDVKAAFTTTRHTGELPWGGSFGFGNDVEVALPYDSRTNNFTIGTEWMRGRNMLRVAYDGSWFNNLDDTLVWDSPLRLDDSTSAPGHGRMALWPTNSAQSVSAAGYSKFAGRTQVTGSVSFGFWNNDQPLQPFTINTTLPQIALPRTTTQAEAHVFSTNVGVVSRAVTNWEFNGRVRVYDYNNETAATPITQYVSYDTSVSTSATGGPLLYAHDRTTYDANATYTGLSPLAMTVGYTRNNNGRDFRIFESTGEDVLHLTADAIGSQFVTFRAQYDYGSRTGSGLDQSLLTEIGEIPTLRHYDLADRTRHQFTGLVDFVPSDLWTFSVSAGLGKDNFANSELGLQDTTFRTLSFGADYTDPSGLGVGGTYNYERYLGLQRSRTAGSTAEQADPNRDWTADTNETVNYFSIYVTSPKIRENTEARVSYDFSFAEGSYLYTIVPGGPLAVPAQLPNVHNKLQQLHVDVRHRLTSRLALSVSYLYEPFDVYDFAFDPSVVNSIVQPSSLVLGYVYRPYTANSGMVGLRYMW